MKDSFVYVIGAGASYEYGLPIGFELKSLIEQSLSFFDEKSQGIPNRRQGKNGDDVVWEAIRYLCAYNNNGVMHPVRTQEYMDACREIVRGLKFSQSIDNYIHSRNDKTITQVAKLAIAKIILDSERKSNLFGNGSLITQLHGSDVSLGKESWVFKFLRLLTHGCRWENLPERFNQLWFVVFNYDRCLEIAFYIALRDMYGKSDEEVIAFMDEHVTHRIFHPYGQVGHLMGINPVYYSTENNERESIGDSVVTFGFDFGKSERGGQGPYLQDGQKLVEISKMLNTFTESTGGWAKAPLAETRKRIDEAKTLVFLGFAFYPQNLDLLKVEDKTTGRDVNVIGTSKGISEHNLNSVKSRINKTLGGGGLSKFYWMLEDCDCSDLFDSHTQLLTFPLR